jgi:putative Holliday junction resolvase
LEALKDAGTLIGLDPGTKTIGVATGRVGSVAAPIVTLRRTRLKDNAAEIETLAVERGIGAAIIGLPLNMDGSEGPRAQSVRAFARNLAGATSLTLAFWDERLSTAAVERSLIALDTSRAKRAAVIDAHAAAFILQGALDRLARLRHVEDLA